jgi:hypothetical protein
MEMLPVVDKAGDWEILHYDDQQPRSVQAYKKNRPKHVWDPALLLLNELALGIRPFLAEINCTRDVLLVEKVVIDAIKVKHRRFFYLNPETFLTVHVAIAAWLTCHGKYNAIATLR